MTLLLRHDSSVEHDTGPGHPERADRIRAIEAALADTRFDDLAREDAPRGTAEAVTRVHPAAYFAAVEEAAPKSGMIALDGDTIMSPGTWGCMMHAIGGATRAVDAVMGGQHANAFLSVRPPGHHAEISTPMGFCLFNHAAIAARYARTKHGAERVALVDWDVHHGNGSQDIFWDDGSVLYCSTHQMPLYPGTGAASERGDKDTIVNVSLRPNDDGAVFREAFEAGILSRLETFRPDVIVISAGFDAHRLDPLANLLLEAEDFGWATRRLMDLAERCAGGRIVSVLEGGYSLEGLAKSTAAHVDALMGR